MEALQVGQIPSTSSVRTGNPELKLRASASNSWHKRLLAEARGTVFPTAPYTQLPPDLDCLIVKLRQRPAQ